MASIITAGMGGPAASAGCPALYDWLSASISGAEASPPRGIPAPAACWTSLDQAGATSIHCQWSHGYRAPQAAEFFDHLRTRLKTCSDPLDPDHAAPGVNHPDTYLRRTYRAARAIYAVALKDKAQQRQTHVFLHATPIGD